MHRNAAAGDAPGTGWCLIRESAFLGHAVTVPGDRWLEGDELRPVDVGHSDTDDTSVRHVPDLDSNAMLERRSHRLRTGTRLSRQP